MTLTDCEYIIITISNNVNFLLGVSKVMKKTIAMTATILLLFITTALAAIDENTARDIAAKAIPVGAKHLYTKSGSMEYEIQFINENTKTHYELTVSRATGMITESKTRLRGNSGSNSVQISEQQARNILLQDYPSAVISSVKLETDNGYKRYHLDFSAGTISGSYEINPETGVVIEKDLKYK